VVHAVNPKSPSCRASRRIPSVLDVPGQRRRGVHRRAGGARDRRWHANAAEKGVRGLVVISAGFAETGADGASLQRELLEVCRRRACGLIGPNCMGVVNTDPEVQLNGTFSTTWPPVGASGSSRRAARSGSPSWGRRRSSAGSVDVRLDREQGGHLRQRSLSYWDDDPNTDVVLMYLESFGNPRRFAKLARGSASTRRSWR
jgi:hypothetical protein